MASLTKMVETLAKTVQPIQPVVLTCNLCAGNHSVTQCPINAESVQYVASYNQQQPNNSSYYHPEVRNLPNQSWSNNQAQSFAPRSSYQSGFQNQPPSQQEKESNLEELLNRFMAKIEVKINNQDAVIQNLENQVGQLASAMHSQPQGALPSNTEINPRSEGKEQCNAVTLRNGKELLEADGENSKRSNTEMRDVCEAKKKHIQNGLQEHKDGEQVVTSKQSQIVPPVPFPQRLQKNKLDNQFSKFLEVFKKLHINIPFADALEQMPSYLKFLKEILSKKRKLGNYETVALTEECSAILQKKLPPKLKDPGSFTIPCTIGSQFFDRCLCDLGASINLMPLSVYKKLGLKEAKATHVTLQLADRSFTYPKGIVEDVLVKVDKFIFPADFIVLDFKEDKNIPIILGRPFLATGRALIDVQKGELTMRVQDEEVTFNVFNALELLSDHEECHRVDAVRGHSCFYWKKKDENKFGGLKSQGQAKRMIKNWLPRRFIKHKFDPG